MQQKSMTALMCAFARAYHACNNDVRVFDDSVARQLFSDAEYRQIAGHLAAGAAFFQPPAGQDAVRWTVDTQLSPTPLGRAAYAERALQTAVRLGARQYLLLGAGYDTFAYRQPAWAKLLRIFELDYPATLSDKRRRLEAAGIRPPENLCSLAADFVQPGWERVLTDCPQFDGSRVSFCSLLGGVYYLSLETFTALLRTLHALLPVGSALAFDYPDGTQDGRMRRQALLADAAGESMQTCYSYRQMERLLESQGFLIYEHLTPATLTEQYFAAYNRAQPAHPMQAMDGVHLCLAVKH